MLIAMSRRTLTSSEYGDQRNYKVTLRSSVRNQIDKYYSSQAVGMDEACVGMMEQYALLSFALALSHLGPVAPSSYRP